MTSPLLFALSGGPLAVDRCAQRARELRSVSLLRVYRRRNYLTIWVKICGDKNKEVSPILGSDSHKKTSKWFNSQRLYGILSACIVACSRSPRDKPELPRAGSGCVLPMHMRLM
jgi:hypothetical protein